MEGRGPEEAGASGSCSGLSQGPGGGGVKAGPEGQPRPLLSDAKDQVPVL